MTPQTKTGQALVDHASEEAHAFLLRFGLSKIEMRNDLTVLLSTMYLSGANDALRDETERMREWGAEQQRLRDKTR